MSYSPALIHWLLGKAFLNEDFAVRTPYLSLHNGDPGRFGAFEVSGGGYKRQAVPFAWVTDDVIQNTEMLNFLGMPEVEVGYLGLWDAPQGGTFMLGSYLTELQTTEGGLKQVPVTKRTNNGDPFQVPAGWLLIRMGG